MSSRAREWVLGPLAASLGLHAGLIGGALRARTAEVPARGARTSALLSVTDIHEKRAQPSADAVGTSVAQSAVSAPVGSVAPSQAQVGALEGAPSPNQGGTLSPDAMNEYASRVRALIDQRVRYPIRLQRLGIEGRANLVLTVAPGGTLRSETLAASSGHAELDELALAAARAAQPFPQPPGSIQKTGDLVLRLPVEFRLK